MANRRTVHSLSTFHRTRKEIKSESEAVAKHAGVDYGREASEASQTKVPV